MIGWSPSAISNDELNYQFSYIGLPKGSAKSVTASGEMTQEYEKIGLGESYVSKFIHGMSKFDLF